MRRKIGLTPDTMITSRPHPKGHVTLCEKCVDSENCFILDSTKCKSGVIKALGLYGTNFTTNPIPRDFGYVRKIGTGSHHR